MPFKTKKKDAAETLTIEWILPVKNYKLTLDKNRCVGCQICTLACPKEAITTQKQPKTKDGKTQKPKVDIDLKKCNFCGICDLTCPHGAITVTLNGTHDLQILTKESYPQLARDIQIDTNKCPKECTQCQSACPLQLINITKTGFDGKPIQNLQTIETLTPALKKRIQTTISIDKQYCPTCKICEAKCPENAIKIKKTIEGTININQEKCPTACTNCIDICPITGTLTIGEDNKVHINETFCTYCGACKNVCPEEEALTIKRTKINHTPIHSGTWNKALERLTSPADAAKELRTIAGENRHKLVSKRFVLEENVR